MTRFKVHCGRCGGPTEASPLWDAGIGCPSCDRPAIGGMPFSESYLVPRGQVYIVNEASIGVISGDGTTRVVVHPSTVMEMRCGGRTPLWTRHELGVQEAERDRRHAARRRR